MSGVRSPFTAIVLAIALGLGGSAAPAFAAEDASPSPADPVAAETSTGTGSAEEEPAAEAVDDSATAPAEDVASSDDDASEAASSEKSEGASEARDSEKAAASVDTVVTRKLTSRSPTASTEGSATITVHKGGDRASGGAVEPLAGATFVARAGDSSGPPSGGAVVDSCTTNGSGTCTLTVPVRDGSSGGEQLGYWVAESDVPAGYSAMGDVGLGHIDATKTVTPYSFFTGGLSNGASVSVPRAGDANPRGPGEIWPNVRTNPTLQAKCGLSLALVFDTSGSISASEMAKFKTAAKVFLGTSGLGGTATNVTLFSFATRASAATASFSLIDGGAAAQAWVDNVANIPSVGNGFTNWDESLRQVANAGAFDGVLFLTDGDPTTFGNGSDLSSDMKLRYIDNAVFSANAVKAKGTAILPIGIGLSTNSELNLAAISGPTAGVDYFLVTNFDTLAGALRDLADSLCSNTLTIEKRVVDASGAVLESATLSGWSFTASGPGITGGSETKTTDEFGAVGFDVGFTPEVTSRQVGVVENLTDQQAAQYTLLQTGGLNANCGPGVAVTNSGDYGFTVTVAQGAKVTCVVTNVFAPRDDLSIVKTHSTIPVDGVEAESEYTYNLAVTNNGTRPISTVVVTDQVADRLQVTGVDVPAGWADESTDNAIRVTSGDTALGVGETVNIVVHVTVLPSPIGSVGPAPEGTVPEPPADSIENQACVTASPSGAADVDFVDSDESNNCDDDSVPLKDIVGSVWFQCVADAAYLHYAVRTTPGLSGQPITLRWAPDSPGEGTDPAEVVLTLHDGDTGRILWPGEVVTDDGVAVAWPGWRPLAESDYGPDGQLLPSIDPATVWNGMILDSSLPDYVWRLGSTVTLSVNPSVSYAVSYPGQDPACAVARDPDLTIDKTVSTDTVVPGGSFSYGLSVTNHGLGAAGAVTITDPIPAELSVTGIETSTSAFPRWQNCHVSGANGAGYGGTLECTLFGPLISGATAPSITVHVRLNSATTATVVDNVATVTWNNFDDPTKTGSHSDNAVVHVTAVADTGQDVPLGDTGGSTPLANTGNQGQTFIAWAAFVALLAGAVMVLWSRWRNARNG